MKKMQYILLCGLLLLIAACEKDTFPMNFSPALTTGTASDIFRVGATLSGSIQKTDGIVVKDCGILISELQSMAEYTEIKTASTEDAFEVMTRDLEPGKKYYYCVYASSGYSIARGEIKEFTTTDSNAPVFSELDINSKDEKSITVTTTILDEGGSELILCGFCWKSSEGDSTEPTLKDNVSNASVGSSAISACIKNLEPNKSYQVRAYGINAKGVGYGRTVTVLTNNTTMPAVSSITPTDSTALSVSIKASILSEGESGISEIGFCWSAESKEPTTAHLKYDATKQLGHSEFNARIEGLKAETTYYIRAYAINEQGTGYGNTYTFTTSKNATVPVVSSITPTDSTALSISVKASILSEGEPKISEIGFCWSAESKEPTTAHLKYDATKQLGHSEFNARIEGLKAETTYYIRAYAINGQGTGYGYTYTFTTGKGFEVKTLKVDVNGVNIKAHGQVTPGTRNNYHGFEVATNKDDLLNWGNNVIRVDVHTNLSYNETDGTFSGDVNNLKRNTTYYIRAWFMSSSQNIFFGNVLEFKTGGIPGIYSLEDLIDFRNTKYADGDLSSWKNSDGVINLYTDIDLRNKNGDISISSINENEIFDGNNHTISNMEVITYGLPNAIGLVYHNDGIVRNLSIKGEIKTYMSAEHINDIAGGAFCYDNNGTIINCHSYVNIESYYGENTFFAGIAYRNTGTIQSCSNHGNIVNASKMAAGIVCINKSGSANTNAKIISCVNKGNIKTNESLYIYSDAYLGGICAYSTDLINDCTNSGQILNEYNGSSHYIGGISGYISGTITNCLNEGILNTAGSVPIGGICGKIVESSIYSNNVNKGFVNGDVGTNVNAIGDDQRGK